jgi:hypothetical protein
MSDDARSKADSIAADIAGKTGLDREDVKKILGHLGLDSAIAGRPDVSPGDLRIVTGQTNM